MWGWLPGCFGLLGLLMGPGRLGGLPLRKAGRLTVSRGFVLTGGVGLSGAWCRKHACHASASCLCGEWGVVGALARVCGGGMLSGFWGSAPWLPEPSRVSIFWGFWVGVGGLVVNCIVDASILL